MPLKIYLSSDIYVSYKLLINLLLLVRINSDKTITKVALIKFTNKRYIDVI